MSPAEAELMQALGRADNLVQLAALCPKIKDVLQAQRLLVHVRMARQLDFIQLYSSEPEPVRIASEQLWRDPRSPMAHHARTSSCAMVWWPGSGLDVCLPQVPYGGVAITVPDHAPTGESVAITAWLGAEYAGDYPLGVMQTLLSAQCKAMLTAISTQAAVVRTGRRRDLAFAYAQAGYSAKAIAHHTGLSIHTVRRYLTDLRAMEASISDVVG
ncbi:hypothetical protein N8I74_10960 [Chitiniphilus purpureus]|uniref:HTH luxR-type domain-containing protein n=1 Tax=Chitiniphilus purpureus TaxID=2981137 RepID=A0ABY6DHP1_9NEIS|nr:hypothetical protein [Chitiniphilus sp. CD1]UXY13842.1 hypothetical protein N8I74_10960 [Chitiniphilus sp. CD1]